MILFLPPAYVEAQEKPRWQNYHSATGDRSEEISEETENQQQKSEGRALEKVVFIVDVATHQNERHAIQRSVDTIFRITLGWTEKS